MDWAKYRKVFPTLKQGVEEVMDLIPEFQIAITKYGKVLDDKDTFSQVVSALALYHILDFPEPANYEEDRTGLKSQAGTGFSYREQSFIVYVWWIHSEEYEDRWVFMIGRPVDINDPFVPRRGWIRWVKGETVEK